MSSKSPIVKQIAWSSLLPQLAVMGFMFWVARWLGIRNFVMAGAMFYLGISFMLRFGIPFHHRKGVRLFKKHAFLDAIPFFEKSYHFFKRHSWIDRYRYLTLLSSSRISYREMALLNMAYCYGQTGDGKKSIEYYQKTLSEFPDSEMAKASLRMYASARNITRTIDGQ